jgi:hypothetical protein
MPPTMTAALLTSMPALAARIVPLSTSAPKMVLSRTLKPVLATMVPMLTMLPANVATGSVPSIWEPPIAIPPDPAEIVPLLLTSPTNVLMSSRRTPLKAVASVPSFSMSPEKTVTSRALMAPKSEEIVTVFATEPSKIDTSLTKMPRAETSAEILPTLLMSPVKVVTSLTSMPVEPAAILPAPLLTMSPEKSEAFSTKMPSAPAKIVPALLMLRRRS